MAIQLDLFQIGVQIDASAAVNKGMTQSRARVIRSPVASNRVKVFPAHRAPRGDAFRELFEQGRNCSLRRDPGQRTVEDEAANRYWRLHWSALFRGKRKLKGPVAELRRKVGRNRTGEFDQWLRSLGIKGSSTEVRYRQLLVILKADIKHAELAFRYMDDEGGAVASGVGRHARLQLERATSDVGELQSLLGDMGVLFRQLRKARLEYVCRSAVVDDPNPR